MSSESKIRSQHLTRRAYIYVRQSSPGQVMNNAESARRQRDLAKLAANLGWASSKIKVLDDDQGKTGQCSGERQAFKKLVGDVCMEEVGIILGLQVSRLARNAADWFPLIEMCRLTDTLVGDEDGIYDTNDRNDSLILGIKGAFSEIEVGGIRAQLQGARWSKAHRGELRRKTGGGFVVDSRRRIVKDPNERVRSAVQSFFASFKEIGTASGVARAWCREGRLFPRRPVGTCWDAPVEWKPLGVRLATHILHNPTYAGAYVYGERRAKTVLDPETRTRKTVIEQLPMEEWEVLILDHHEGYISWEEYLHNRERLKENRSVCKDTGSKGAARRGETLLQGIAFCGKCGRQMTIRYSGKKNRPHYMCHRQMVDGCHKYCSVIASNAVDHFVEEKVLKAIEPIGIEAALSAFEELERRAEDLRRQWQHRIEQAEYEAGLARRRYEAVDPDNRLVADNLERDWEGKLQEVEKVKKEYEERASRPPMQIRKQDLEQIRKLSNDIPKLWRAKATKMSHKKEIIRILIRDVWLCREKDPPRIEIQIHWQTGVVTEGKIEGVRGSPFAQKFPDKTIERVRKLNDQLLGPKAISEQLNREGFTTGAGKPFTSRTVDYILRSRKIVSATKRLKERQKQKISKKKGKEA